MLNLLKAFGKVEEPVKEPEQTVEKAVKDFRAIIKFLDTNTLHRVMKEIVVELDYRENGGL